MKSITETIKPIQLKAGSHADTAQTGSGCSICGDLHYARGLCRSCYRKASASGELTMHKKKSGKGLPFLLGIHGEDCVRWPYGFSSSGYGAIWLDGRQRGAHEVACLISAGTKPGKEFHAAHKCGNKWCVNPKHLRWVTPQENIHEKIVHGTQLRGEGVYNAKLSSLDVLQIRQLAGSMTNREIAKRFSVTSGHIGAIIKGGVWSHV